MPRPVSDTRCLGPIAASIVLLLLAMVAVGCSRGTSASQRTVTVSEDATCGDWVAVSGEDRRTFAAGAAGRLRERSDELASVLDVSALPDSAEIESFLDAECAPGGDVPLAVAMRGLLTHLLLGPPGEEP